MTFIGLVMSSVGVIALLLLAQELRYFRHEARETRHAISTDLTELQKLLLRRATRRNRRAAREAAQWTAARRQGWAYAEQRIDVGRVLDEADADKWLSASDRFARARASADVELLREQARPDARSSVPARLISLVQGLVIGAGVSALLRALMK